MVLPRDFYDTPNKLDIPNVLPCLWNKKRFKYPLQDPLCHKCNQPILNAKEGGMVEDSYWYHMKCWMYQPANSNSLVQFEYHGPNAEIKPIKGFEPLDKEIVLAKISKISK